jgi:hypothetical protein
MSDDDVRKLAGHPDAIPQICIEWFLKGWRACEQNTHTCKCCGKKMKPQREYEISYICMNPYCDNYIKVQKDENNQT